MLGQSLGPDSRPALYLAVDNGGRGAGEPPDDGMERIAKLEVIADNINQNLALLRSDISGLRTDVSALREKAATMEERVSHLPRKDFIVAALIAALAAVAGFIGFADQIRALIAGG